MDATRDRRRIGAGLVCGLVLIFSACFPFVSREPRPDLLDVVRAVGAAPPAVDSIWPGYSLVVQGFLLYEPESAILVTSAAPPPGFTPVPDSLLPPRLRGRTYAYRGSLPGLDGGLDTGYRLGDIVTTAYALQRSLDGTLTNLYHEGFHTYQQRSFQASGTVEEFVPPELLTREFVAMAEVERRMLARALELEPGAELDSLLASFLAVRRERLRGLPPRVRQVERMLERKEGSANLVGHQLAAAALGAGPARVEAEVRTYLTSALDVFGGDRNTQVMRSRAYGTGAAMGLLLDRLGVAWRGRLEQGAAFDSMLAEAVGAEPAGTAAVAQAALEAFGYAEVLEDVGEAGTAAEELAAFYRQEPARFVIEILPRDTAAYRPTLSYNFSVGLLDRILGRRRGTSRPEPGLTLVWKPELVQISQPETSGFRLRVEDRSVAFDFRERKTRYQIVVLLPELPAVLGRMPGRGTHEFEDGVEVEGEKLRFGTDLPATLVVAADSMHVRISP
ncbi:MAG TPA: hypothetical protein VF192_11865 [Longimicrobiales bacterium]